MGQKRNAEANERKERAANQEQYMQDLHNAMAAQNLASSGGPRIEEVAE